MQCPDAHKFRRFPLLTDNAYRIKFADPSAWRHGKVISAGQC